jgi:hypothetical protein
LVLGYFFVGDWAPILSRDSIWTAGSVLPLAACAFLIANYACLRERPPEVKEALDCLPSSKARRTGGLLMATYGPLGVAALVMSAVITFLLVGDPIGGLNWWELGAGLAMVALFSAAGVALARWLPHPAVAPLALVAYAFIQLIASPDVMISSSIGTLAFEWLAPFATPSGFAPADTLVGRPAELRLAYLLLLTIVIGLAAVTIGSKVRTLWVGLSAFGVLLALTVVRLVSQPSPDSETFDWVGHIAEQPCEREHNRTYCTFPLYREWVPRWEATLSEVGQLLPIQVDTVVQRPSNISVGDDVDFLTPGLLLTDTEWDRAGSIPQEEFQLAIRSAMTAVGLPTHLSIDEIEANSCDAIGQARSVVVLWASMVTVDGSSDLVGRSIERSGVGYLLLLTPSEHIFQFGAAYLGSHDAAIALELLKLPAPDVTARLQARWDEVTDPATGSDELAGWFGVTTPTNEPEHRTDAPACP